MTISISLNGYLLTKQQKTMTREELINKRDEEINDMIDRFNLEEKCAMPACAGTRPSSSSSGAHGARTE